MAKRKNLTDEKIQTLLEDSGEYSSDFEEDEPLGWSLFQNFGKLYGNRVKFVRFR